MIDAKVPVRSCTPVAMDLLLAPTSGDAVVSPNGTVRSQVGLGGFPRFACCVSICDYFKLSLFLSSALPQAICCCLVESGIMK